jgi:tetratricopeptide (TPR) repeat protein
VLVAALVVTLLPALLTSSLELIPFLVFFLTEALDLYVPLLMITTVLGQVLLAFAYAFQIAFFTLLYYDLRFRGEGYDLVMQAHRGSAEQAKALLESGVARLKHDDLSGARADFEQARALLPDDRTILGYCMGVKLHLGDPAGALKDCEHALALFPDDPHLLHCRGLARHRLGDVEGAQADYDRALRLFPNEVTALLNRALLKHKVGAYDDAREDWLQVLKYKPGESIAIYNIACGYARQGQVDAALDWLGRAIAQEQRHAVMAREDRDFQKLRADSQFMALVGASDAYQAGTKPEHV